MPLLLDNIRAEFARYLAEDPTARFRMDAALAHVATAAYQQGLQDGNTVPLLPASIHSAAECAEAFEWLRTEATKDGASEHAGVALDELHALATGRVSYGGTPCARDDANATGGQDNDTAKALLVELVEYLRESYSEDTFDGTTLDLMAAADVLFTAEVPA